MTPDLYKILKVRRTASKASIKKAYRRQAGVTHPDRNSGEDAKFKEVQLAWEVLSDDSRRAKYDATGEIDEKKADQGLNEVVQVATAVLADVIAKASDMMDLRQHDLLNQMRVTLSQGLDVLRGRKGPLEKKKVQLEGLIGRFSTDDGEDNVLEGTIKFQIGQIVGQVKSIDDESDSLRRTLEYLRKFKFRCDPFIKPAGWNHGNNVSSLLEILTTGKW